MVSQLNYCEKKKDKMLRVITVHHFVALSDCIRSGYVGGQLVITRNILSFFLSGCYHCMCYAQTYHYAIPHHWKINVSCTDIPLCHTPPLENQCVMHRHTIMPYPTIGKSMQLRLYTIFFSFFSISDILFACAMTETQSI